MLPIHKCRGLSLDCTIIDLLDNVFCGRMAYVVMLRVCTLQGLHLTAFNPKLIIVGNGCLEEVNRLHSSFRKDLPLYKMPIKKQLVKCNLLHEDYLAKKKPKFEAKTNTSEYIPKVAKK